MGNTSNIIKAASISTAIVLINVTLATAEELPEPNLDKLNDSELPRNLQAAMPLTSSKRAKVNSSAKVLPASIGIRHNYQNQQQQLIHKSSSIPIKISQAPPEISEPEEPISDPSQLDPSSNPLSFPTKTDEVQVDPEQPISLQQAIELAIKNNRDAASARLTVKRAEQELQEARAALFPNLDLGLGIDNAETAAARRTVQQAVSEGRFLSNDDLNANVSSFDGDLTLTYDVYAGGERGADIRRANRQLRFNQLDLERIVEQVRFEAASDYYNLQDSDAVVAIEKAAVQDAQQTLKDAQLLEKAGLGTRFDVLRAEVELANTQQRLTTAISDQDTARRQLARTLSLGEKVTLKTADAIAEVGVWEFSLEESIVQAYKNRAELEQFLLQREISEEQGKIAISAIRPRVSIFGRYEVLDQFDDNVDIQDGYAVGASLQWRLFDGGAASAAARQQDTNREIAESEFANQRNDVRLEVEQAYFSLQANKKNISTADKAIDLAEESLRLARLRFSAGVGTQTEVINSQTELTRARGNLLSAVIDYNQSYIALQRAVTNLPDGGLLDLP